MSEAESAKYAAYICYSHRDEKDAAWLHRHLERYHIPRGVAPDYGRRDWLGRRIGKVFRDREELPAGQPLTPKLHEALAAADSLVVLCSPKAVASRYVNDEITEFRRLGKGDRIFPVILEGEPPACYPPSLEAAGENLNADFRQGKDGSEGALIKILAGLMGVGPDDLYRRERRAQRRRAAIAGAGATVFAVIAALAILFGVRANQSERRARSALVGVMVERAQHQIDAGNPLLALRYALVAYQLSPPGGTDYVDVLTTAYDRVGDGLLSIDSTGMIAALALSPDGRLIASGVDEHDVMLWDAATGRLVAKLPNDKSRMNDLAFSPDGRPLLAGAIDGKLVVWDYRARRRILAAEAGNQGWTTDLTRIAFSPDGRLLVSVGNNGDLHLWNTRSWRPDGKPIADGHGQSLAVAFSHDGKRIVSGSGDNKLRLWDVASRRQIGRPFAGHRDTITSVAFSPDDKRLVSGGAGEADNMVRIWDIETGEQSGDPMSGHSGYVQAVAFSPDGDTILSASSDKTLRLWDSHWQRQIGQPLMGHEDQVLSAIFSADGRRIVSAAYDGRIRVWAATPRNHLIASPDMRRGGADIISVHDRLSRDGSHMAALGATGNLKVWNVRTGRQTDIAVPARPDPKPNPPLRSFPSKKADPDDLLAGLFSGMVNLPPRHDLIAAFSADGRLIATVGDDRVLRLWESATGRQVAERGLGDADAVKALAFSPDGRQLASGGDGKAIRRWDVATLRAIGAPMRGHTGTITALDFSPDGRRIASASDDHGVRLWDSGTGRQVGGPLVGSRSKDKLGNDVGINAVAFSPDGTRLASAGDDGDLRLWDTTRGSQIGASLVGHTQSVQAVAFSPDGQRIASTDGMSLRVWDAMTGRQVGAAMEHFSLLDAESLWFSPDGRQILTPTGIGVSTWDVHLFTQARETTIGDACSRLLDKTTRTFLLPEIQADPVLLAEWPDPGRDVCEGVPGVPPLRGPGAPRAASWSGWFGRLLGGS